jgi:hypothetical protein
MIAPLGVRNSIIAGQHRPMWMSTSEKSLAEPNASALSAAVESASSKSGSSNAI